MSFETSFRGGARIGWLNASWPFAKLTSSRKALALSCLGSFEFSPAQVVAIEPYRWFLSHGMRIHHNRPDYPEKLVFWNGGDAQAMIREIARSGFVPAGAPGKRAPGFALRWSVIILGVLAWNGLLFADGTLDSVQGRHEPGIYTLLAILLLFAGSSALAWSSTVQKLALNPGHVVGEIKASLVLVQVVSALLSLGFAAEVLLP